MRIRFCVCTKFYKMLKEVKFKMTYEGKLFPEVKNIIKILSKSFNDEVRCVDIIADSDAPEDSEDKFIMKATFSLANTKKSVDIYYTDNTRMIIKIEWNE